MNSKQLEPLDRGTWGGSKAAHVLVEKLNALGDSNARHACGEIFNQSFNAICQVMDKIDEKGKTRGFLVLLVRRWGEGRIKNELPVDIQSYAHNVLVTRVRKAIASMRAEGQLKKQEGHEV